MFMQIELEACLDELVWLIRCHNCAAYNCPEEEYPPRPLPIPPDIYIYIYIIEYYVDNLQSRLVEVEKAYYHPI